MSPEYQQPFNLEVPQNYQVKEESQENGFVKAIKALIKLILIIGAIILLIPVALIAFCLVILFGFGTGGIGLIVIAVIVIIILANRNKKNKKPSNTQQNYLLMAFVGITLIFLFAMGQSDVQSFNCPAHYDFYYVALPILQMSWLIITGVALFGMILLEDKKTNYKR